MKERLEIRSARPEDTVAIHGMICELAVFEKMSDQVVSTPDSLRESLFGGSPNAEAIVADCENVSVGFAIFFFNFSTFTGKPGLYLEDVYVSREHRQQGVGKALLTELARIACRRDCGRFEWSVLDWNENAISFYEALGANVLPDWRIVRLDRQGIERLAQAD